MENYEKEYKENINELMILKTKLKEEKLEIENILEREVKRDFEKLESDLDVYDYLFAVFFGVAGAKLSSSKEIESFLNRVHKYASEKSGRINSPEKFIGNLLHHQGDAIDIPSEVQCFINRQGENSYCLYHRLLWGHDILSVKNDNPITLMVKSEGIIEGSVQATRHLIADTFSKQGLPLPGSSNLDYIGENGKVSNGLIYVAQKFAEESGNKGLAQECYSHMFTLRIQDVMGQGMVGAAAESYFRFRNIKNKIRKEQYKILSYSINFMMHALIGTIRQNGIPYINWSALAMCIKSVGKLVLTSRSEIKKLTKITDKLIKENDQLIDKGKKLEKRIYSTGKNILSYDSGMGYIEEYIKSENSSLYFMDFLGEE